MVRKIILALVWIPLAVILLVFAVANRHLVTVSFDPFDSTDPSVTLTLPLFAVIILSLMVGVIAGGITTWFRQSHWRRAARRHEADARDARTQLADLHAKYAPDAPRVLIGRSTP